MRDKTSGRPRPVHLPDRSVVLAFVGMAAAVIFVVGGGLWWLLGGGASAPEQKPAPRPRSESTQESATVTAGKVETPELVGLSKQDAEIVLQAAGLKVAVSGVNTSTGSVDGLWVVSATPPAGTILTFGDTVRIVLGALAYDSTSSVTAVASAPFSGKVVCLDPGHQEDSDREQEPVGPGSAQTKDRMTGGTTGTLTGIPEYEVDLQLAFALKRELESRGVTVLMTRTTNDVSLSNAERARVANKAGADLTIRIHCGASTDAETCGVMTYYPEGNAWVKRISSGSKRAALLVHSGLVGATSAVDLGVVARSDFVGFNWSKTPVLLVECGFLSNPVEDRLLASPHYQDKVADGIADGVTRYLQEVR